METAISPCFKAYSHYAQVLNKSCTAGDQWLTNADYPKLSSSVKFYVHLSEQVTACPTYLYICTFLFLTQPSAAASGLNKCVKHLKGGSSSTPGAENESVHDANAGFEFIS